MKVFVEYSFIFEPNPVWRTRGDFDLALAKAFKSMGYEAENVVSVDEERTKMVFLKPVQVETKVQSSTSPGKVINKMSAKRDFDGKYIKKNG